MKLRHVSALEKAEMLILAARAHYMSAFEETISPEAFIDYAVRKLIGGDRIDLVSWYQARALRGP